MLTIKNVYNLLGQIETLTIESSKTEVLDAQGALTAFPALIDPDVDFRISGSEVEEDWISGAKAAIAGGITMVFDRPKSSPPCCNQKELQAKSNQIERELKKANIPLRYQLYYGADKTHIEELGKAKEDYIAIYVYIGSQTPNLVMDEESSLERLFQLVAQENQIIALHADQGTFNLSTNSKAKNNLKTADTTEKAILLAEKYSAQLLLLNVSSKEEIDLIRNAKKSEILVYTEVSPYHLFLTPNEIRRNMIHMGHPPSQKDQDALWEALHDTTIDLIGSNHHSYSKSEENKREEKEMLSGAPSMELLLPLLLNAYHEKKIAFEEIVSLTRLNSNKIFQLPPNNDLVLVDLTKTKKVEDKQLKTKCGWSPYAGKELTGWPVYTIINGEIFEL